MIHPRIGIVYLQPQRGCNGRKSDPPVCNVLFSCCRQNCELPCDTQLDCNTLCECYGSCGANSYCTCSACEALAPDAASDSQFFTIQNAAASSGAASASVIAGELVW